MLHELRYYEIAAGRVDDYIDHAGKVAAPFRGDDYGKLLGFWACEYGGHPFGPDDTGVLLAVALNR